VVILGVAAIVKLSRNESEPKFVAVTPALQHAAKSCLVLVRDLPPRAQVPTRADVAAVVLERSPRHGYAVIASLRDVTDGVFSLNEGAVYPVLHQLEAERLISSRWDDSSGRRRRSYSLTKAGRVQLRNDAHDWEQFRIGVETVLKEVPWLPMP
jgi:DNA-binding PadR family transcriptional regulator